MLFTFLAVRSFKPKMDTYYDKHYTDTTARIPPYLIGILLGWLLHKTQGRKIYINKVLLLNNSQKNCNTV
jgi:hypothetical protein